MLWISKPHKHGGRGVILATSSEPGKSDTLVNLADDLETFVRQAVRNGSSLHDVERGTLSRVLEIGFAAVELFLNAQGEGDLGARVETDEGAVLYRSERVAERPLRTIFGEHSFTAYVYSRGPNRKIELRPIDARINLPEG